MLRSAAFVRLLRRNGSQRGLGKPGCSEGGVTIGRDDRRQRRAAARQSVGQQADDRTGARAVTVVSYSSKMQSTSRWICDGDGAIVGQRGEQENTAPFRRRPIYLFRPASAPAASGTHSNKELELASRALGTTAFAAAQVGENCGDQSIAVARWAPTVLVPTKTYLQASLDDRQHVSFRRPLQ